MNEAYIPSAHEPTPNEVAEMIRKMEDELKELQKEQDRLIKAVEQFPNQGFEEQLKEITERRLELNKYIEEYFKEKNKQTEFDFGPEK